MLQTMWQIANDSEQFLSDCAKYIVFPFAYYFIPFAVSSNFSV